MRLWLAQGEAVVISGENQDLIVMDRLVEIRGHLFGQVK
jgi:hypothetical protein